MWYVRTSRWLYARVRVVVPFRHGLWFVIACTFSFALLLNVAVGADSEVTLQHNGPPEHHDRVGDALFRPVDGVPAGSIEPEVLSLLPDIAGYRLGAWRPDAPATDLFVGKWVSEGGFTSLFFRLDIIFVGLVCPSDLAVTSVDAVPSCSGSLIGCVEIDMDASRDTGGNFDNPAQGQLSNATRYLGTIARSGGLPADADLASRCAWDISAFDGDISTAPWVDRSGEEFHLLFGNMDEMRVAKADGGTSCGVSDVQTTRLIGKSTTFGAGDRWLMSGFFFHRAHGYTPFSNSCCPQGGEYEPRVQILWNNDATTGQTTVSLVYPLGNAASATMLNQAVQDNDGISYNQNSVLEGLDDLIFSVTYPDPASLIDDPNWPIIADWEGRDPALYLNPANWRVTIVVGTTCDGQGGGNNWVWTDWYPDGVSGDYDGNGVSDGGDAAIFDVFMNGQSSVTVNDFGSNFSLFDRDYNGVVNATDRPNAVQTYLGDFDGDGDVDLEDFGLFQACLTGSMQGPPASGCEPMDLDQDQDVDWREMALVRACLSGSNVTPPAGCLR